MVSLKVKDICHGACIQSRAIIVQIKTVLPVQFELTLNTSEAVLDLITQSHLNHSDYLFKSRIHSSDHLSTQQYGRIVDKWGDLIGLDKTQYGTHTMRRTKP